MRTLYKNWMHRWERQLTLRDSNRRTHPFDWGLDWLDPDFPVSPADSPKEIIGNYSSWILENSWTWFTPPAMTGEKFDGRVLTFQTPTPGPVEENNLARCRFYPARNSNSAVIVVPQWNAGRESHAGLCRLLANLGINAVRMTQPYHEERNLPGAERADYMLSPNIGRTLNATRQSVLEVRQVFNWLKKNGFDEIGIIGTSLGSCVAYLSFVHEPRFVTGVFNHAASFFSDIVWHGMATRFVRAGLEGNVTSRELKKCWAPLDPWNYVGYLKNKYRPHLLITGAYDLTFLPRYYKIILAKYRKQKIPNRSIVLPCGHYTLEKFPFIYLDGWHISFFLKQQLNSSIF